MIHNTRFEYHRAHGGHIEHRGRTRCLVSVSSVFSVLSVVIALATGASAAPAAKELPGIKPMLADQVVSLEREIAARMARRPETPADKLPRLEMEIDLRICARWLLLQAHSAAVASDMQASCRLRAKLSNDVIQTVRGKGYGVDLG